MIDGRLIDISGSPRERGRAHGKKLRREIAAHADAWRQSLLGPGIEDPAGYVSDLLSRTDFLAAIRAHAPDLLEEVEGIAQGAGLQVRDVYALQLVDEEWAFRERATRALVDQEKCSGLAMRGEDGAIWLGQTMDLGGYTEGHQAVLRIAPHGGQPGQLVCSLAGMIGLMGVNTQGVGVCVNSLPQLANAPRGLPVAFVLRTLLGCATGAEAAEMARRLPHATGQHYLIAGPDGIWSLEAAAGAVAPCAPQQDGRYFHTNHPLSGIEARHETEAQRLNSTTRLAALARRLGSAAPGFDAIATALASRDDAAHPICRLRPSDARQINFTTCAIISRRIGNDVEAWASVGPPSVSGFEAVDVAA
jgi:hypothetical protein